MISAAEVGQAIAEGQRTGRPILHVRVTHTASVGSATVVPIPVPVSHALHGFRELLMHPDDFAALRRLATLSPMIAPVTGLYGVPVMQAVRA